MGCLFSKLLGCMDDVDEDSQHPVLVVRNREAGTFAPVHNYDKASEHVYIITYQTDIDRTKFYTLDSYPELDTS